MVEIIEEPISTEILTSEHVSAYFLVMGSDKKPGKNRYKIKDFELVNNDFQGFKSADINPGKRIVYLQLQANWLAETRGILGKEDITAEDIKSVCKDFIGFTKADCFDAYGDKIQNWTDQTWSCDQ